MKARQLFVIVPVFAILVYVLGPAPEFDQLDNNLPTVPEEPGLLEEYINRRENNPRIKHDNEARVIWFDSSRSKTACSIVYLHGFRASQKEGDPIHRRIANTFGCNLYLNRLPEHGIDTTDAFINFTADKLWANAKESLAIGKVIGDNVIIISTSTGGTAAIYLASLFPDDIYALINMSPNVEINDAFAFLLNNHWGAQLARLSYRSKYLEVEEDSITSKYWMPKIRIESLAHLEEFVEKTMTVETFSKVNIPSLTLYYYKNELEQDPEVKVERMLWMHQHLATPDSLKSAFAIPSAGEHCLGSELISKDVDEVYDKIEMFLTTKVNLRKIN